MRKPPIKIVKLWIHEEIMKAGHTHHFLPDPPETLGATRELLAEVILQDRLNLTDAAFRHKYVKYIKRSAP